MGASKEGSILVVDHAEGDEELGPLVPLGLRGIILRQELPHLSHLGVRARQERVTFATLDDKKLYESEVQPLMGRLVKLQVAPGSITLAAASSSDSSRAASDASAPLISGANQEAPRWSVAKRATSLGLVPLIAAVDETCGAKAARCADLERLSVGSKGLFKVSLKILASAQRVQFPLPPLLKS